MSSGNILVQITLPALDFFFEMTKNYGVAIILLTVAIKLVFWNMTAKQYESMEAMKKIQPKLKALQEKHKSNPQKLQEEMIVLYKEHSINPFSGCLPMLIQLPVLFALFATLGSPEFIAKTAGKTFLWIRNISFAETMNFDLVANTVKHPSHLLVSSLGLHGFNTPLLIGTMAIPLLAILVGVTTYYSQKSMGGMDPQQQRMMAFMPIFLVFISINLNAGVLLYWIVSNALTAVQQQYIQKQKPIKEELAVGQITHIK